MHNGMMKKYLGVLFRPLQFLGYFLAGFCPRTCKLWVFGSWDGRRFADNSAALFVNAPATFPDTIVRVWITRKYKILRALRAQGHRAYLALSPRGLYYCLRAEVYVYDGYAKDINYWTSRGALRITLQHGPGGFKCIERDIRTPHHPLAQLFHGTWWQRLYWRTLLPWHLVRPDIVICASHQQQQEACTAYAVDKAATRITGLPRNDVLFQRSEHSLKQFVTDMKKAGQRVLIHMPTLRDTYPSPFPGLWRELDDWLSANEVHVIAHQHFAQRHVVSEDSAQSGAVNTQTGAVVTASALRNVHLVSAEIDLYGLFAYVDGLITDLSSVAFDFLLTNKPVVHFMPDYHRYLVHCRELRMDFNAHACGPMAVDIDEFKNLLSSDLTDSIWQTRRERLARQFHQFADGQSSARVYAEILNLCANTMS